MYICLYVPPRLYLLMNFADFLRVLIESLRTVFLFLGVRLNRDSYLCAVLLYARVKMMKTVLAGNKIGEHGCGGLYRPLNFLVWIVY